MLQASAWGQGVAYLIAAAMYTKLGGHCDRAAEEEQSIKKIQS